MFPPSSTVRAWPPSRCSRRSTPRHCWRSRLTRSSPASPPPALEVAAVADSSRRAQRSSFASPPPTRTVRPVRFKRTWASSPGSPPLLSQLQRHQSHQARRSTATGASSPMLCLTALRTTVRLAADQQHELPAHMTVLADPVRLRDLGELEGLRDR